jgi:hypothetical protein
MLDQRPCDRFRQRACQDTIDYVSGLGRGEHVLGHGLDPATRVDFGAAAGLGKTFGLTPKRSCEWRARQHPHWQERQTARPRADPARRHHQA